MYRALLCILLTFFLSPGIKSQELVFPDIQPKYNDTIEKVLLTHSNMSDETELRSKIEQVSKILLLSMVDQSDDTISNSVVDHIRRLSEYTSLPEWLKPIPHVIDLTKASSKNLQEGFADIYQFIRPISGTVIGTPAYIRTYPSSNDEILNEVEINEKLFVLLRHGDWYAVILPDKTLGYIFRDLLRIEMNNLTVADSVALEQLLDGHGKALSESAPENAGMPSTENDLRTAVNELADIAEREVPTFASKAFQCRSDLQQCRSQYGYIDCELTMIACVISSIGG